MCKKIIINNVKERKVEIEIASKLIELLKWTLEKEVMFNQTK